MKKIEKHTRELESPARMKENTNTWIGGILELGSKVRYGMTTRGVPMYRFVPYDKKQGPYAVGCSQRRSNILSQLGWTHITLCQQRR